MWIVAKTEPKKEKFVADNIERQGHEFYLPRIKRRISVKHIRLEPLFPSYIFCNIEESWRFLSGTFGVLYILMFGGKPGRIEDEFIENLRAQEDEHGFVQLPEMEDDPPFDIGQPLRLRSGPFLGYIGLYDGQSARDRERVLLEIMGRTVPVYAKREDLEAGGME